MHQFLKTKYRTAYRPTTAITTTSEVEDQDTKRYHRYNNPATFYQNVGESDCDCGRSQGRLDPVLKLYRNCELMLTTNENVRRGKANGTQYILNKIVLKSNQTMSQTTIKNRKVSIIRSSQISYLECKTKGKSPKLHKIKTLHRTFTAKYPLPLQLKIKSKS